MDFDGGYDDRFLVILVMAIAGHILLIAIVVYYACCRGGCVCKKTAQTNTVGGGSVTSRNRTNSDASVLVESDERPNGPTLHIPTGPVSNWWQTSILTRVRSHLDRHTSTSTQQSKPEERPPPYNESLEPADDVGNFNEGACLEEALPTYQEYVRQSSFVCFNEETGQFEIEKPPDYEEAVPTNRL